MKLAIALSGGGSKGAWIVGAIQYLLEERRDLDCLTVYGTSTGALAAPKLALYQVTRDFVHLRDLVNIYTNVSNADILKPNHDLAFKLGGEIAVMLASLLGSGIGVYKLDPLQKLIDKYITDEQWQLLIDAGQRGEVEVGFCATNVRTHNTEVFSTANTTDIATLKKAMLASAAQPVLMEPVLIGKDLYVDGGVRDLVPVEKLFESPLFKDADGVLTLATTDVALPEAVETNTMGDMIKWSLQTLTDGVYKDDIMVAQMWNLLLKLKGSMFNDQYERFLTELPPELGEFAKQHLGDKKYVPIWHVTPRRDIISNALEFDKKIMKKLVVRGFKDMAMQAHKIPKDPNYGNEQEEPRP